MYVQMWMNAYIRSIRARTHVDILTYIHTDIHIYIQAHIHTYIHTHTDIQTYRHTCTNTDIPTCIHTYIRTHIHTVSSCPLLLSCVLSSLSGTYIGPSGAIVLAGGLATNCTIQQLHLSRVSTGGVGTAALARSVTGHPVLRFLDLSYNVGDVDEGWFKRDRLEELEAAQAKQQERLQRKEAERDARKAARAQRKTKSVPPKATKVAAVTPSKSAKTSDGKTGSKEGKASSPAKRGTTPSRGTRSASPMKRGTKGGKAKGRDTPSKTATDDVTPVDGDGGSIDPTALHSHFTPRLKKFKYKAAPNLPQGVLEERERVITAFAELILGVPGRWITFKEETVLTGEEKAQNKREYQRKIRQEAALQKTGRTPAPVKGAVSAGAAATPIRSPEAEEDNDTEASALLSSVKKPAKTRKEIIAEERAKIAVKQAVASDPGADPTFFDVNPFLPPNYPADIIGMTLPVVRLKRKPLPMKLQTLILNGNGITDQELCRISDSLAAATALTELRFARHALLLTLLVSNSRHFLFVAIEITV
jgi:hypothetical protein